MSLYYGSTRADRLVHRMAHGGLRIAGTMHAMQDPDDPEFNLHHATFNTMTTGYWDDKTASSRRVWHHCEPFTPDGTRVKSYVFALGMGLGRQDPVDWRLTRKYRNHIKQYHPKSTIP